MRRLPAYLVLLLVCALAHAQTPPASDDAAKARGHYDRGMGHFQLEEWDAAIEEWKEGFRIKPVPEFLYNIAQAYRLSKRNEQAVGFYQKYLRLEPKAPNKAEVERHIAQLSKIIDAQAKAQSAPPVAPLPTEKNDKKPPAVAETRPDRMSTETPSKPPATVEKPVPPTTTHETPPPVVTTPPVTTPPTVTNDNRLVATPPPATPIYKKGWFWGVIGGAVVVVVGVTVGVVVATGGDSTRQLPAAHF
jgi:hypothetical protein